MNAVVSLCHFCEVHGPSVLLSTQAYHDANADGARKAFYGDAGNMSCSERHEEAACEACQSLGPRDGYVSSDHAGGISYLTTQRPMQRDVATLVQQACIRSLSCEVSPGKEGPVFFGDETRGHVLSRTFSLADAQARGYRRWFSVTVLMRDKLYLLNSWPFLVRQIGAVVAQLQDKAAEVHKREQFERPQRSLRLAAAACCERTQNKPSRSPAELTGDPAVFPRLHAWFAWLLRAGAERLTERVTPDPVLPTEMEVHCQQQQSTDEGFILVYTTTPPQPSHSSSPPMPCTPLHSSPAPPPPAIASLRHLRRLVGTDTFLSLAHGLLVGRQVVVRGTPPSVVASTISCLAQLVPTALCRARHDAGEYVEGGRCNLLGVGVGVAVPRPGEDVVRLDVMPPEGVEPPPGDLGRYTFRLGWSGQLPAKYTTLLYKMEKAMDNEDLKENVMQFYFAALKEEWLNIAKVVGRLDQMGANADGTAVNELMKTLGAQEQDKQLLRFWSTAAAGS